MRRSKTLSCAGLMLCAGLASAQYDPDPDGICVCFNMDATEGCNCIQAAPESEVVGYLVITNPSQSEAIAGFELAFELVGMGALYTGVAWAVPAINTGPPGIFIVGFSVPLPAAPVVVLAELYFEVVGDEPTFIYLSPIDDGPDPLTIMSYHTSDNPDPIEVHPCTGYDELGEPNPVACINCDCEDVISAEQRSWGSIKSLYR